jgi:hypothetical protein
VSRPANQNALVVKCGTALSRLRLLGDLVFMEMKRPAKAAVADEADT